MQTFEVWLQSLRRLKSFPNFQCWRCVNTWKVRFFEFEVPELDNKVTPQLLKQILSMHQNSAKILRRLLFIDNSEVLNESHSFHDRSGMCLTRPVMIVSSLLVIFILAHRCNDDSIVLVCKLYSLSSMRWWSYRLCLWTLFSFAGSVIPCRCFELFIKILSLWTNTASEMI